MKTTRGMDRILFSLLVLYVILRDNFILTIIITGGNRCVRRSRKRLPR
jgi:hypothetical protein